MPLADAPQGPLVGYRVLELCSTIAGPACARLLADFGAEVIKVESFEGDAVRSMAEFDGEVSLYGIGILRNKKVVAINIKAPEGRDLVLDLAAKCDVVVENFRPGTLERLGLGYDQLSARNPGLVLVRISGYGQSGPYAAKAGYGAVCDAFAGVRHMTGDPDRPPARIALPATDYLTAVYGAFGASMALLARQSTGKGQVVDLALYEAAFSMLESIVPGYDRLGSVPARMGSRLPGAAPNNLYPTADGSYVLAAANNDQVFKRLVEAIGRADLAADPRFATIRSRGQNPEAIDAEISAWTSRHTGQEAVAAWEQAGVPTALVNTIADIFGDPHFRARDMLPEFPHPVLGMVTLAGIVPKLSDTPGAIHRLGQEVGFDTAGVLAEHLGLDETQLADLVARGVVAVAANNDVRTK